MITMVEKRDRRPLFRFGNLGVLGVAFWAYAFALLYSFPWLRIPDVSGVALPFQRLISWFGLAMLFFWLCLRQRLLVSATVRIYLGACITILVIVSLSLAINVLRFDTFDVLSGISEYSKYIAVFAAAYIVYTALESDLLVFERVLNLIVLSGTISILLSYLFLILYWVGFRTENEIVARTFGGALGVWPTNGLFPRLAGTGAEPQQLSILFLTPLLIMSGRRYIKTHWPVVLLGMGALGLSQSKFALISLIFVVMYFDLIYRRHRLGLLSLMIALSPSILYLLARLPAFALSLELGFREGAFVERFENIGILMGIVSAYPLIGIGIGQYGIYRGQFLYSDPGFNPSYRANNDLLSIFAETGVFGFVITIFLLVYIFIRSWMNVPRTGRVREVYLAFLLGTMAIFLNMFIGYAFLHVF